MQAFVLIAMMGVLMLVAPAAAQASGKWIKGAPFPEPSEELVGGSMVASFTSSADSGLVGYLKALCTIR
jgi:hypothetical protein